jgi:hypothetical protein
MALLVQLVLMDLLVQLAQEQQEQRVLLDLLVQMVLMGLTV